MTKQEKISEEIDKLPSDYCSQITGRKWVAFELTKVILRYLHSQGLVLKVEGELPDMFEPAKTFHELNKDKDFTLAQWMTGYITCREGARQAGYTKWKSLKEE